MDVSAAVGMAVLILTVGLAYAWRASRAGGPRFARVEQMGESPLLNRRLMDATYWGLQPLGRACVRLGISANAITWLSLFFGALAGVGLALGRFGLAALFAMISSLCDALDGLVARTSGKASDAGEVFDASVDRYVEFFFCAGLIFFYRAFPALLAISLAALLGSFMVSYSTAKAEALGITPPRGAMRRPERAAYLTVGAGLTPLFGRFATPFSPALWTWPLIVSLVIVALVANISAVRRFMAIAKAVRTKP